MSSDSDVRNIPVTVPIYARSGDGNRLRQICWMWDRRKLSAFRVAS